MEICRKVSELVADIDVEEARRHFEALDPEGGQFVFQTFWDDKEAKAAAAEAAKARGEKFIDPLAKVIYGSLAQKLNELNRLADQGAGIFVTINETNGGRGKEDVTRIRAVWQDDDSGWDSAFPIEPSMVIQSSPGKFQRYWFCDGLSTAECEGVLRRIVKDFGGDKGAQGINRVFRLAGSVHQKDPRKPQRVSIIEAQGKRYTRNQILEAFPPLEVLPKANGVVSKKEDEWTLGPVPERIRNRWVEGANNALICDDLIAEMDLNDDNWLIARIEASKQGPKFSALFNYGLELDEKTGEMVEGLDRSHMDASLVGILAFWTRNDVEQTYRIMCRSKLAERDKWVGARGDTTYGWMTVEEIIGRRIAGCEAVWGGDDIPVGGEAENVTMDQAGTRFPEPFRGFMADMVSETLEVAPKPQPELTLLSVLVGMASACDGRVQLPDDGRLNLYGLGVVESGEGKDLPRRVAEHIGFSVGAKLIGTPGSGQGLEDALIEGQGMLCAIDEVGHVLQALHAEKAPAYAIEISKNLLRLYSASNGVFVTREKALVKGVRQSRTIRNPALNLIGFTTPGELSKGLSSSAIDSGLLGRFLFVPGNQDVKQRFVMQKLSVDPFWFDAVKQYNIDCMTKEIVLEIPEETQTAILKLNDQLHLEQLSSNSPEQRALLKRTLEKIKRVAGVLAFWDGQLKPTIELDHLEWAERFVRASNSALLEFCRDRIHDGPIQASAAKVVAIVTAYLCDRRDKFQNLRQEVLLNENRIVARSLVLRDSGLSAQQLNQAVEHAVEAGQLEEGVITGEGNKPLRWLALPS